VKLLKPWPLLKLVLLLAWRLVLANIHLAMDILRPNPPFQPAFIEYSDPTLHGKELVALATIISLTPGTLTVDLSVEKHTLLVHSLYAKDEAEFRARTGDFARLLKQTRWEEKS